MVELEAARTKLDTLGLGVASQLLDARLEEAVGKDLTYLAFLNSLLESELAERRRRSEQTRLKLARLPQVKTLDEFDFSYQPGIDERQVRELATLAFLAREENVVFLGPPGVGKTHIAIALLVEAIRQGMTAYCISMSRLITELKQASAVGSLERKWRTYLKPKVLLIDEVGYMRLDREAGSLFFRLVNARYEKGSIILTSNKGFGEWGDLMGDSILATAILDRLLHHAQVVNIRGSSYRLKSRMKTGLYGNPSLVNAGDVGQI